MAISFPCIFLMATLILGFSGRSLAGEWIDFEIGNGERLKAFVGLPSTMGKHPAVIYQHGALVRRLGPDEAAHRGYDVRSFVDALNKDGYVAIAPVTELVSGQSAAIRGKESRDINSAEDFSGGIDQGIRAGMAALRYLQSHPSVDPQRIAIIGFSEGGLVATWLASDSRLRAAVIMSPALMLKATELSIASATKSEQFSKISIPILVTTGNSDDKTVLIGVRKWLIPGLQRLNKQYYLRDDYSGGHEYFYQVRENYWNDIRSFLDSILK